MTAKLIFFSGSNRKESLNKKLAIAAGNIAKEIGAVITVIDLTDYDLPIYNGDYEDENGIPNAAKKLKVLFKEHDGFFIASPEYNSSFSSLLKNTIDWMTRGEEGLIAFQGKVAALSAASPGGLGGIRGLVPLRMLLGNIGVHVIPQQMALSHALEAFDDHGALNDEKNSKMLQGVVKNFVETTMKMKS